MESQIITQLNDQFELFQQDFTYRNQKVIFLRVEVDDMRRVINQMDARMYDLFKKNEKTVYCNMHWREDQLNDLEGQSC
jgi:hypothetical protein